MPRYVPSAAMIFGAAVAYGFATLAGEYALPHRPLALLMLVAE